MPSTRSQTKDSRIRQSIDAFKSLVQPFGQPTCCKMHRVAQAVALFEYIKRNFTDVQAFFDAHLHMWKIVYDKVDELMANMSEKYFQSIPAKDITLVRRLCKRLSYLGRWFQIKVDTDGLMPNRHLSIVVYYTK
jgi:hypothetical protein